ncbi:adenylate/guanylate cyclase [Desulfobacca acetoxidans DSM 11109]|uniref:Adenylate/guanylate cyclase n=2 Tax=Desulfobacca acetoxidans TaxID=60893 RepID=F2NFS8_DESAR|nr:adenylate/guanylate cyclase [Desulfobacca acetoxidans DSM 11109]
MLSVEEELIDRITATFHYLRTGKVPPPIPIPDDLPDNEIRQLITYVNRFLVEFAIFNEAMEQIARGELNTRPMASKMVGVHSFKALQSNLKHLTWKTQQIAAGDLDQRVDFMGDFSTAFNSMTQQLKDSHEQLVDLNKQLERRNKFIRETFGRYTSDDIVGVLLDMPEGLKLGGEKREVTLLMSDLRGFTAMAERLEATEVVALLNHYLSAMVELIHHHGGTIDEIIGDAIFVLFGAPMVMPDAARRAVRCAINMQKAMRGVNEYNFQMDWPEIEMGIGIHTGEVVVGNIGSTKRSKYGVVGRTVNLTARIESFTVGGQVLVSPTLINAVGRGLILGDEVKVHAKGMREPLKCRELLGHGDYPELMLEAEETIFAMLSKPLPFHYIVLTDKHLDEQMHPATLTGISQRRAVVEAARNLPRHSNIMLRLEVKSDEVKSEELYAKVVQILDESSSRYVIHFTSIPLRMRAWLQRLASTVNNPRAKEYQANKDKAT